MKHVYFAALAALSFACSGAPVRDDGDNPSEPGAGTGPAAGGQSGGSGSPSGGSSPNAGSGGTPDDRPHGFNLQCPTPQVGSPALRLLTRTELESSLNAVFPELQGRWSSSLPANTVSRFGFDNDVSNVVGNQLAAALLETAEAVGTAASMNAQAVFPCSGDSKACVDTFLDKYGKRLFRRALTADERQRYQAFFESARAKSDVNTALKWLVAGLIQSPHAVYRREIGVAQGDSRQLSPHEIASQLAFTYTGKAPSAELLAKADSNSLGDGAALVALAKEMLNTEDGKKALQRFFEAYVGYPRATAIQRPNVPNFSASTGAMVEETRSFIQDVLYQRRSGLKELLTAPSPAPTGALTSYYSTGPRGLGVLGQGAFLSTHATSNSSSPTQRGNFVYLRLLCGIRLEVPPDVPQIVDPTPTQTTRQRYEEVHVKAGAGCAGCHTRFDPIGFGFEHFDEGGRYREKENGFDINAAATAIAPNGRELFSFTNQAELVTGLANEPLTQECFSAHLAAYAFGTNEACLGSSNVQAAFQGQVGIVDSFAELAAEPHFTRRKPQ